jgi:5-methyltetrahydrofolate--homocysteine methyltransferase
MDEYKRSVTRAIINGNVSKTIELVKDAVDEGIHPRQILDKGLIAGMKIVSKKTEAGEMFIPEAARAAKAMSRGIAVLKPLMPKDQLRGLGKVVIGTSKFDLNTIEDNLADMTSGQTDWH